MNRKRSLLIFNRILLESIQASGKRKTQEPFLYKLWHKLWHTFYETLCQKMQNFTIKQGKTAQNRRFLPMAERKGSCNSEAGEFTRKSDRLRSTICCKQQCYAFVRQIAQSLAMSAALDFRKCKRLLLSALVVSLATQGFTPQAARCNASCRIPSTTFVRKTDKHFCLSVLLAER